MTLKKRPMKVRRIKLTADDRYLLARSSDSSRMTPSQVVRHALRTAKSIGMATNCQARSPKLFNVNNARSISKQFGRHELDLKSVAFRLSDDELDAIVWIRSNLKVKSDEAAVRYALRFYFDRLHMTPLGGHW